MKLGIFAKVFSRPSLEASLDAIRDHGISHLHFNMSCAGLPSLPEHVSDQQAAHIGEAVSSRALNMVGVSATFNMIHPDPEVRDAGLLSLRAIARVAQLMGTRVISLCTGTRDPKDKWRHHPDNATEKTWLDLRHGLQLALAIAQKHKVVLAVEPETGNVVSSAPKARLLLDEMESEHLKIILDPANLFHQAQPKDVARLIDEALDLLQDDLIIAHAKDRDAQGRACAAGKGIVPFDHFLKQLDAHGFEGPLVVHGLSEAEVPASLAFLQDAAL